MSKLLPWLLLSVVVAGSVFFLSQWHHERIRLEGAMTRLPEAIAPLVRQAKLSTLRLGALGEGVQRSATTLDALRSDLADLAERLTAQAASTARRTSAAEGEGAAEVPVEDQVYEYPAPAPPAARRYKPHVLAEKSIEDVLSDDEINPEKRMLDRVGYARAALVLEKAKSQIHVLTSEINLHLAEGIEDLRADGDFIEYPKSDPPPVVSEDPQLITVGEGTDNGTVRMYWLFPEQFPDVYKLREERDEVSKRAIGELMAIVQGK